MDEIKALIDKSFDPLADYIPSVAELEQLIHIQEVFVIKIEGKVAGVSIYQNKGTLYFRLSCVHPDHRPGLFGYMLASTAPTDAESYAWIDDANASAIKLNTSLGYIADGLKNYLFVKKTDYKRNSHEKSNSADDHSIAH